MKTLLLFCALALPSAVATAQAPAAVAAPQPATAADVYTVLRGDWTGVLEYRDYKSDGRVKLPTWLSIKPEGAGLRFRYVYDDGPTKTVTESLLVTLDVAKATYTSVSEDAKEKPNVSTISGLDKLKAGRGTLVLAGTGTDNDKPAEVRTTLRIGRNIVEILRETKLAGEDFKFRHAYIFTRAEPPVTKP